jgi:ABC-type bacteriocin/lantibiotic exporter with double-glycine peptidase domain
MMIAERIEKTHPVALKLYFEIKNKILILILILISAGLEFIGISLIYPLVSIIFNIVDQDNTILSFMKTVFSHYNLPLTSNWMIILIIIIMIFKSAFLIAFKYITANSVMSFMLNLRKSIYTGVFNSRFGFVSDEISRVINGLTIQSATAAGTMDIIFKLTQTTFTFIALLILGLIISWKMFVLASFLGLGSYFILNFTIKYSKLLGEELALVNERLLENITGSLKNYRYIKSVEIHDIFYSIVKPILKNINKIQIKFVLVNHGTKIISEPIIMTLILTVLIVGLNYFEENISALIVVYIILLRFFTIILGLIANLQNYSKDVVSVKYCYKLIDEFKTEKETYGNIKWKGLKHNIAVESVGYGYNDNLIFDNVSIKFIKNKITVLYGKSGSGKTTLLNIILGLLKPSNGVINVDDVNISKYDLKSYRNKIGMVTQDSVIFNLTIGDNLRLRNREISDCEIIKHIINFDLVSIFPYNKIDLNYHIDESVSNLSGGEKQRLALIRELVSEPEILILDEVTSSLDTETISKVIKTLEKLKGKVTIIIVTHQKEYLNLADEVYNINKGIINKISNNQ